MLLNKKELKKIFKQEGKQVTREALELLERWVRNKIIKLIRTCHFKRFTKDDILI